MVWYRKINMKIYFLLFAFLSVFYVFNDVGVDTPHYRSYFDEYVNLQSLYEGYGAVEKLYQLLNVGLHYFFTDGYWAVAFVRFLQLALFFRAIYLLRDKTIIGFAVMAYVAFFYFDSFNLLRSSLAGSLTLISFAYIDKEKPLRAIIAALLAMGFHTSGIFMVLTMGIYYLCYKTVFKRFQRIIPFAATIVLFVVLFIGGDVINMLLADDFGGGRYADYEARSQGIGLFILLKYFLRLQCCIY